MTTGDIKVELSYGEAIIVKVALEQSMARLRDPSGPLWRMQERVLAKVEQVLFPLSKGATK